MSLRIECVPQDLWVGVFWKREFELLPPAKKLTVWICLLPCLPIVWRSTRSCSYTDIPGLRNAPALQQALEDREEAEDGQA